jgi:hypothetical protein
MACAVARRANLGIMPGAGTCAWRTRTIYFIEAALLALLVLQIRARRRMAR